MTITLAALYARVSTTDKGQDRENQLAALRDFCDRNGLHGTGKTAEREQFQKLFCDAARCDFDLVIVWSLDRFSREGVAGTFIHIKRLADHGVKFLSFTEEHFRTTGPAGELMIAIAAWIARQERIRISERVKAGLHRVKLEGSRSAKPIGRPRAVLRRDRVRSLREQGLSWSKIANELGSSEGTVRRVFQSALNAAAACQNLAAG